MWMAHLGVNDQNTRRAGSPVPSLQTDFRKLSLYCKHSPKALGRVLTALSPGGSSIAISARGHSLQSLRAAEGHGTGMRAAGTGAAASTAWHAEEPGARGATLGVRWSAPLHATAALGCSSQVFHEHGRCGRTSTVSDRNGAREQPHPRPLPLRSAWLGLSVGVRAWRAGGDRSDQRPEQKERLGRGSPSGRTRWARPLPSVARGCCPGPPALGERGGPEGLGLVAWCHCRALTR
ncbi:uncharacterized protein LOC110596801 [Carlito syrichta]|uniref:Uncharacterized protein LOC110596801 n=1 Tax=Carlito syrichta TaxID=1868482 RepID=A0A3Q0EKJ9_CARSF|nr:uncharacterized protein LOC110596801 [Carlito syrichta]XP_021574825.1 uncharacterized protein LOC110596801 [Carlito syrichta]